MSSSRPLGRIWRGVDAPRVSAASFAVELPGGARARGVSVVDRIEAARAEGWQQGHDAALGDVAASAEGERRQQLAAVANALVAAAGALTVDRHEAVSAAEDEVVRLAVELAEAIVRRDLAMGSQPAAEALQRALSLAPDGADLLVRLHPGDAIEAEELQLLVPERSVRVLVDDQVEPGGCLVEAGPCHIDAQIGPAVERARRLLAELHPASATAGAAAPEASPAPVADELRAEEPVGERPAVEDSVVEVAS